MYTLGRVCGIFRVRGGHTTGVDADGTRDDAREDGLLATNHGFKTKCICETKCIYGKMYM